MFTSWDVLDLALRIGKRCFTKVLVAVKSKATSTSFLSETEQESLTLLLQILTAEYPTLWQHLNFVALNFEERGKVSLFKSHHISGYSTVVAPMPYNPGLVSYESHSVLDFVPSNF